MASLREADFDALGVESHAVHLESLGNACRTKLVHVPKVFAHISPA